MLLQYEVGPPVSDTHGIKTSHEFRKGDAHNVNGFSCKVAVNPLEKLVRATEKLDSDGRED